jgi:protein subunit release factor A
MEKIVIEIRDQEGGEDAKLLVKEMKDIYLKAIKLRGYNVISLDERDGSVDFCL